MESSSADQGRPVPVAALVSVGVALTAVVVPLAWVDIHQQPTLWLLLAPVASIAFLVAMWVVSRGVPPSGRALAFCLLLAAICRAPWLLSTPTLSDDIYRYIWDGRLQLAGHSPYVSAPADPALEALHTPETRLTNQPKLPTIYPPAAQWFFRGVAALGQSVMAFKVAFVCCDVAVVAMLLSWLSRTGRSRWLVLGWAWNPLVVMEIAGSGHLDALGTPLLFATFLALNARLAAVAAVCFVAAVGVKFLPIVLAPYFLGRVRWRDVLIAGAFAAALTIPFMVTAGSWSLPLGALPTYMAKWRVNSPIYLWLDRIVTGPYGGRTLSWLPVAAGLAVAWPLRRRIDVPASWAWPIGASLIGAPAVFPWYLLWVVPFLVEGSTLPLLVWTQTVLLSYAVWPVFDTTAKFVVPGWAMAVQYGGLALVGAWCWARARKGRTA